MKHMNLIAPIGGTGYGITSLNILKHLSVIKELKISLFPIGQNFSVNNEYEKNIVETCISNNRKFEYEAPCLKIWHQNDLATKVGRGRYAVFPFFEIDTLNEIEKHHLNFADVIFVASSWAKNILIKNGITRPIHVAPLGVDMTIFNDPARIKVENPNYTFFHIGKWEKRKSQDFLLQAFDNAFTENDSVELWLFPHNPFLTKEEEAAWLSLVQNSKLKSKIKLYGRLPTQYDLANAIFTGDCGIFLSRAEGWNNEILECMAMNKPIITTNYSAHTEYCDSNNSYLVDITEIESAIDNKWFDGFGNWAKLDQKQMDQTVELMRFVYNNNIRTNNAGIETAKKYNWYNTSNIIYKHIYEEPNRANSRKKKGRR